MNRRSVLILSIDTALALALLPSSATAQQKTLKEQLVGAWNLTAFERTSPDGSKVQMYGANPKGVVAYYGADGHFFALFARDDLPVAANNLAKATPEEKPS